MDIRVAEVISTCYFMCLANNVILLPLKLGHLWSFQTTQMFDIFLICLNAHEQKWQIDSDWMLTFLFIT